MSAPVAIHRLARRDAGLQLHHLPVGAVIELPDGRRLLVQPGGQLDPVLPGGHPRSGIGSDPTAGRVP